MTAFDRTPESVDRLVLRWFVRHYASVVVAGRRTARAHSELDGALVVARSVGDGGEAAQVMKYELDGYLVEDLESFRRECVSDSAVEEMPDLAPLAVLIDEAVVFLREHVHVLRRVVSADRAALAEALIRLEAIVAELERTTDWALSLAVTAIDSHGADPEAE